MHPSTFLSTALLLTLASALPLNINLGAYSPALVVGDGAIEFEGGEATEGVASQSAPNPQQPQPQPANKRFLSRRAPTSLDIPETLLPPINPPIPVPITPPIPVPPAPEEPADPNPDPSLLKSDPDLKRKTKRQDGGGDGLAGFDRALQFAEVALTKGPDIQLGTGAHGAGVGMIVDNNQGQGEGESVVVPFPAGGAGAGQVPPGGGGLVPPLAPGGGEIAAGGGQGVVVVGRPG